MELREQFVKEYIVETRANGYEIDWTMFNQLREKLYIEWLEKRATIHNKDYAAKGGNNG